MSGSLWDTGFTASGLGHVAFASSLGSHSSCCNQHLLIKTANIGALIIRIGFWGPLYYNHNNYGGP